MLFGGAIWEKRGATVTPNTTVDTTVRITGEGCRCHWCGSWFPHDGVCPQIREIEYHPDGSIKRVVLK